MIFHPSGNFCHTSVNTPPMSPLSRFKCHRPRTSAASAQVAKLQIREFQLAHRGMIRVAFFVSRQHAIPPARYAAASGKSEFRRGPISDQKGIYVTAVPRGLLCAEHIVNCFCVGVPSLVRSSEETNAPEHDEHQRKSLANRTDRKLMRMG